MPKEDDASTKKRVGVIGGGRVSFVGGWLVDRVVFHQFKSFINDRVGGFVMNGEGRKDHEAVNDARRGRRDRPDGIARVQCTSVPRRLCDSFRVNFRVSSHGVSLVRYFWHFSSGSWTVLLSRFHVRPRYLNSVAKGCVLERFHGHPRWSPRL